MTGLRERKKEQVRSRVIESAVELFATKGLDQTTMEDIAEGAEVSVGTVYNYFGSKRALLLAGVADDTQRMVAAGAKVLARPGKDPIRAVKRLASIYLDDLAGWDRRLLREVLSAAYRLGGEELTLELAQMDQQLITQMMELLGHFHNEGHLPDDVAIYDATLLIFSVFALQLFMFISIEGYTPQQLHDQVARQIELAFRGLTNQAEA